MIYRIEGLQAVGDLSQRFAMSIELDARPSANEEESIIANLERCLERWESGKASQVNESEFVPETAR